MNTNEDLLVAARNAVKLAKSIAEATPAGHTTKRWIEDAGRQAEAAVKSATRKRAGKRMPTLRELDDLIRQARYAAVAYRDKDARDEGTCVLGAGIVLIDRLTLESLMLVEAPYQGNVGSFKALSPVLAHLKDKYPDFDICWHDGVID